MSDSAFFEAEQHIGQYEVLAVRGVGEHGVVYQVQREGTPFALKALHPRWAELDRRRQGQWATRLVREFQILNSLHHPCLVPAYDVGWHRGMPFFTMELIKGATLAEHLAQRPCLRSALDVLFNIAQAVAFLHDQGLCHCDVTPSNIIVRAPDLPVLVDLGNAQPLGTATLADRGELLGTLAYISPEHADYLLQDSWVHRYTATPSDDVYALGVILYELLTGRLPLPAEGKNQAAMLRAIHSDPPPHPCSLLRCPRPLADLAMVLLAKSRELRPPDGRAVVAALEKAILCSESWLFSLVPPRAAPPHLDTVRSAENPATQGALAPEADQAAKRPQGNRRRWLSPVALPLLVLAGWTSVVLCRDCAALAAAISPVSAPMPDAVPPPPRFVPVRPCRRGPLLQPGRRDPRCPASTAPALPLEPLHQGTQSCTQPCFEPPLR